MNKEDNVKIKVKNFSFYYGDNKVLNDLNLEIPQNKIYNYGMQRW